jgi:hypothetical protein
MRFIGISIQMTKTKEQRSAESTTLLHSLQSMGLLNTSDAQQKTNCCISSFIQTNTQKTWFLKSHDNTYKIVLSPDKPPSVGSMIPVALHNNPLIAT